MATWREKAAPIIAQVIQDNPDLPIKELKRKISKAYPFGERAYWPYKAWLDEVKRQLNPLPSLAEIQEPIGALPLFEGMTDV